MSLPPRVSEIIRYPLKSCRGENLQHASVNQLGIDGDRRLVLAETDGRFITARSEPQLLSLDLKPVAEGWRASHLNHPKSSEHFIGADSDGFAEVGIWGRSISAQRLRSAEEWFSELLQRPVQLLHNTHEAQDLAQKRYPWGPIFSDGYPLLITNTASLAAVDAASGGTYEMARFRPNLVIDSDTAWAEDEWDLIEIGDLLLRREKPCERCVLITRDPQTGEKDPSQEPLRTLNRLGRKQDGAILFGQNFSVVRSGEVKVGDTLSLS